MLGRSGLKGFASIVVAAVAYAALRYNVFAGVPWADFPLYVSNKGIAMAGAALIALSYLVSRWMTDDPNAGRALARQAGLLGFALSVAHVLASFILIAPSYYPRLFNGGDLAISGVICVIAGGLALAAFCLPAVYSVEAFTRVLGRANWKRAQQAGYAGLVLTAVHILPVGVQNWLAPERWPGGLPPISMISFVGCLVPVALKVARMITGDKDPVANLSSSGPLQ